MNKVIGELVMTRINGNSIVGNQTYENMLKRVSRVDIFTYAVDVGVVIKIEKKIDMIEELKRHLSKS